MSETTVGRFESSQLRDIGLGILIGTVGVSAVYLIKQKFFSSSKLQLKHKRQNQLKPSSISKAEEEAIDTEQLIRLEQYFGKQKLQTLRESKVIVIGLGGVGSHVVNMLVRSGVKHLKIIDFDRVSLSSLSRHAYAVREDVGLPKTEVMKKYILKIFPNVQVDTVEQYATKENIERLLEPCDYVVDCIDNIDAKVALAETCYRKNIRVIISGGAGMKNDATQIQIRDISEARNCELISSLRRRLNKLGVRKGLTCVFSRQESPKDLLPLNEAQEVDPDQYKVFQNYRVRIVPVLGTMPALIGQTIASYVLCQLCSEPYEPFEADDIKTTHYLKVYNRVVSNQGKLGVKQDDLEFDIEDVYILMRYIYKWKCIVTNADAKQFYLTRWNKNKSASIYNLVAMCKQAYDKHTKAESLYELNYDKQIFERYERACQQIKQIREKRGFVVVR